MKRARRGARGEASFVALVEDVSPDLLRYFARRVDQDAVDLLAETLMTAWRRRGDLPGPPAEARMWLFGVARNVLANAQRGARRRHALADALRREMSADVREDSTEVVALRALVDELEPDLAEVVMLAHWEGLSFVEIAEVQKVAPATVRGRYRRAKLALAASLSDLAVPRD